MPPDYDGDARLFWQLSALVPYGRYVGLALLVLFGVGMALETHRRLKAEVAPWPGWQSDLWPYAKVLLAVCALVALVCSLLRADLATTGRWLLVVSFSLFAGTMGYGFALQTIGPTRPVARGFAALVGIAAFALLSFAVSR